METMEQVKIPLGDPVYNEVLEFLYAEAELLDESREMEWLDLLDEQISYRMPVRVTASREDGAGFAPGATFFDDDLESLTMRVRRVLESPMAWSEIPPTRCRRFVTNLRVSRVGDDLAARSSLLLLRSRWDQTWFEFVSARRDDVLRRHVDGLKLARREIFLDQVVMESPNLSVLL